MKQLFIITFILFTSVLLIPTILVQFVSGSSAVEDVTGTTAEEVVVTSDEIIVPVFRGKTETIEEVPLEQYVVGVVASEMPADFEMEALKAQALTARTYIVKQMLDPTDFQLPEGAIITDSIQHQVYHNKEELKQLWGKDYDWKIARIEEAVYKTAGQVLTYEGEPITASFFSTSNGFTENSEDYWQNEIPYLRSVESPWDERSPRFMSQKAISVTQFERSLGIDLDEIGDLGQTIVARTEGGRVATVDFGDKQYTGREIRDLLELDSSDFRWRRQGNRVIIETKGWGHGVGMSQYGADGMAKEGKTYAEIVRHYYQGVDIQTVDPYVNRLTVRK